MFTKIIGTLEKSFSFKFASKIMIFLNHMTEKKFAILKLKYTFSVQMNFHFKHDFL